MRRLFIIIMAILLLTTIAMAKLSDETLEEVNKLCEKHYGHPCILWNLLPDITDMDYIQVYDEDQIDMVWLPYTDSFNITFEDGKLIIETQDGKWFIEMEKVKIKEDKNDREKRD